MKEIEVIKMKQGKEKKEEKRTLWDSIAKSYNKRFRKEYRGIFKALEQAILPGDKVCEVGCGSGLVAFEIAPRCSSVDGIDLSPVMIRVAREVKEKEGIPNVNFHQCDASEFASKIMREAGESHVFDKIITCNMLHVVNDPVSVLEECKNLLKPSGILISITYCHGERLGFRNCVFSHGMSFLHKLGKIPFMHKMTFDDFRETVKEAGFISLKETRVGDEKSFPCLMIEARVKN